MTEISAEIVIVGGGPAGIAAAATAAESGRATLLIEEAAAPGGQVWRRNARSGPGRRTARWLERLHASGAATLANTTIIDADAPLTMYGEQSGRPVRVTAHAAVILAVGARELFLPFPGWSLPGVIGAGGAQALLKSGWDVRGRTVVVAGSGPLLLPVAAALARAGARLAAVAEQAARADVLRFALALSRAPARALDAVRYRAAFVRSRYLTGTWVTHARGRAALREVVLSSGRTLGCDVLCTGYGLVPAIELPLLFGCATRDDAVNVDRLQRTSVPGVYCAGETTGIAGLDAALVQGTIAGLAASGRESEARNLNRTRTRHAAFADRVRRTFAVRRELLHLAHDDTIVCRCEDVTHGAVRACGSLREAKLLTRAGMGACQARVCGPALRLVHGWGRDSVRPPLAPAPVGTLEQLHEAGSA